MAQLKLNENELRSIIKKIILESFINKKELKESERLIRAEVDFNEEDGIPPFTITGTAYSPNDYFQDADLADGSYDPMFEPEIRNWMNNNDNVIQDALRDSVNYNNEIDFDNYSEYNPDDMHEAINEDGMTIYDPKGNKIDRKDNFNNTTPDNYADNSNLPAIKFNGIRGYKLDDNIKNNLYVKFKDSYIQTTGMSWDLDKFKRKLNDWTLFGDSNGFITVRIQQSGLYKLTSVAGNQRSIFNGFNELINTGAPIWGLVSYDIASIMVKLGFIAPDAQVTAAIMKNIPSKVFGASSIDVKQDGSLMVTTTDVGTSNKYLIGNPAYFKFLVAQAGRMLPPPVKNTMLNM